jgi:hypothetical protein
MDLRSLIVVTGTLHVEGGDKNNAVKQESEPSRSGRERFTVIQNREISPDRRRGNVLANNFLRSLRGLRTAKTPFGTLLTRDKLSALRELMAKADEDIAKFNSEAEDCKMENCVLFEPLRGIRLAKVAAWLSARPKVRKIVTSAAA